MNSSVLKSGVEMQFDNRIKGKFAETLVNEMLTEEAYPFGSGAYISCG